MLGGKEPSVPLFMYSFRQFRDLIHRLSSSLLVLSLISGCTTTSETISFNQSQEENDPEANILIQEQEKYHDFSWTLFQNVFQEGENLLVSPLSAFLALSLCANGASGETLNQMEEVLKMPIEDLNSYSQNLFFHLDSRLEKQLQVANCIWFNKERISTLQKKFITTAQNDYQAAIFEDSVNNNAIKRINTWVAEHTNNTILNIVDSLPPQAVMVLLNSLAFEAPWQVPYEKDTVKEVLFSNFNQTTSSVSMMYEMENFYVESQGFKGFIKQYAEGPYAFAVLIPIQKDQSLFEAYQQSDGQKLLASLFNPKYRQVYTGLPQFSLEEKLDLKDALQKMGIKEAFKNTADFSNLAQEPLYVGEIIQKAKIEVDLHGTKAASATKIRMDALGMFSPEEAAEVICDRPFLYFLLDMDQQIPIFMGAIESLDGAVES